MISRVLQRFKLATALSLGGGAGATDGIVLINSSPLLLAVI